jgi:hypothetical protein
MDKVKAYYGVAVNWVAAHPAATINIIVGAAIVRAVIAVVF